jgi:hypothetical protein
MRRPTPLLAVAACIASVVGCADASSVDDICQRARQHASDCLGVDIAETSCDASEANELLTQDCVVLNDGKADIFANGLCRLGYLAACTVPTCSDPSPALSCADYIQRDDCTQCDYYRCREAQAPTACGANGYYLDFAYDYCRRYQAVTAPTMSPAGQTFLHTVRTCLMTVMDAEVPVTSSCSAVKKAGFESHPRCYIESGFCQLPVIDWIRILATISPGDMNFRQILTTGIGCLSAFVK